MSAWLKAGGKTVVFPVAVSLASEIGNWALALPLTWECVHVTEGQAFGEEGSSRGKGNLKSKYPKNQNKRGSVCSSLQNNGLSSGNADSQSQGAQSEGEEAQQPASVSSCFPLSLYRRKRIWNRPLLPLSRWLPFYFCLRRQLNSCCLKKKCWRVSLQETWILKLSHWLEYSFTFLAVSSFVFKEPVIHSFVLENLEQFQAMPSGAAWNCRGEQDRIPTLGQLA